MPDSQQGTTPISNFTLITPQIAEALLQGNHGNRPIKPSTVALLAKHMKAGTFQTTHQGIAVSMSGRLLDGQHRLRAVAQSGCSVLMLLTTGLPDETFEVLDIGTKRSLADISQIALPRAQVAAMLHAALGEQRPSAAQMRDADAVTGPIVDRLIGFCGSARRVFSSAPVRLAVVLRARLHPNHELDLFQQYRAAVHCTPTGMWNSVGAFYRQASDRQGGRAPAGRKELCIRAFRAFNPHNRDITRLLVKDHEASAAELSNAIATAMR